MRVLLITALFPVTGDPSSGVFITRRLKALSEFGVQCRSLVFKPHHSPAVSFLKKALGNGDSPNDRKLFSTKKHKAHPYNLFEYRTFERGLIQVLLGRISKTYHEKELLDFLLSIVEEKPDLISAHWLYPHGYLASMLGKVLDVPVVFTAHGCDINSWPHKSRFLMKRTLATLESVQKAIFVSDALKRKALSLGYSGHNAVVIPNGVDSERFRILPSEEKEKHSRHNGRVYRVGFVGRLEPVKGVDRLPSIFAEISRRMNATFVIVGDGSLRQIIEEECASLDLNVKFTGTVDPDDAPRHMNTLDVMVLPSREEAWGCVVLEAQACGVSVVGTAVGGALEAIGDGGAVVPEGPRFEYRFAETVVRFLQDPVNPKKLRARAINYDWSVTVGEELKVFKEAVSERRSCSKTLDLKNSSQLV